MEELKYVIEDSTIAELLGVQNFSTDEAAILELVKNAYDANALNLKITFQNDTLRFEDNGIGMNADDIKKHWMHIGKSSKEYEIIDENNKKRIQAGSVSACFLSVLVSFVSSFSTSTFDDSSSTVAFVSSEFSKTSDCTAIAVLFVLSCANVGIARENDNANDNTTAKNFFIFMLLASLLLIYVNFIYIHLLPAHEARSHIYCF